MIAKYIFRETEINDKLFHEILHIKLIDILSYYKQYLNRYFSSRSWSFCFVKTLRYETEREFYVRPIEYL